MFNIPNMVAPLYEKLDYQSFKLYNGKQQIELAVGAWLHEGDGIVYVSQYKIDKSTGEQILDHDMCDYETETIQVPKRYFSVISKSGNDITDTFLSIANDIMFI